jgi:uncharacterized protein (UPF0332 family)
MFESEQAIIFLAKAAECLAGVQSEFANRRFNNCANRCYYAVFQAAIACLVESSIRPPDDREWSHAYVQSQFAGNLVNRRKIYPVRFRDLLPQNLMLRQRADYSEQHVIEVQADRARRRTQDFLDWIISQAR